MIFKFKLRENLGNAFLFLTVLDWDFYNYWGSKRIKCRFTSCYWSSFSNNYRCFGGIIRDILLNRIPLIFRKEIYATAAIAGGIVYILEKFQWFGLKKLIKF